MTVTAHDVASALRDRLPGLPTMKLHKLLYYCHGTHLAHTGEPLFGETISAWDDGPVVGTLWKAERENETLPEPQQLNDAQLGTVAYVISRYGALSGKDLSILTHNEGPWLLGDQERKRMGKTGVRIKNEWMADYFTAASREEDGLDPVVVREWLTRAATRPKPTGPPQTREDLEAWARRSD